MPGLLRSDPSLVPPPLDARFYYFLKVISNKDPHHALQAPRPPRPLVLAVVPRVPIKGHGRLWFPLIPSSQKGASANRALVPLSSVWFRRLSPGLPPIGPSVAQASLVIRPGRLP